VNLIASSGIGQVNAAEGAVSHVDLRGEVRTTQMAHGWRGSMNKARAISVTWGACGLLSAAGMVLPWVGLVVTEDQMGYSLAGVGFVFMATGAVWMFGVARLVGLGGGERVSVTRLPEAMCALVRVKGVERIVDGVLVALLLCVVIQGVSDLRK